MDTVGSEGKCVCVFNVNNHTGIQEEKYRGEGLRVAAKKVWKL